MIRFVDSKSACKTQALPKKNVTAQDCIYFELSFNIKSPFCLYFSSCLFINLHSIFQELTNVDSLTYVT